MKHKISVKEFCLYNADHADYLDLRSFTNGYFNWTEELDRARRFASEQEALQFMKNHRLEDIIVKPFLSSGFYDKPS